MLFTVSHVIKTLTVYVLFAMSYVQNVSFSSWRKHKGGAPLLECNINDTLINKTPHCPNMFTKLINVLDLTFLPICSPLVWNLLRIPCTKNYYYYYHFGHMRIAFASFSRYIGYILQLWWTKLLSLVSNFFQDSMYQNVLKSVHYWLSYWKYKCHRFVKHGVVTNCRKSNLSK